MRTLEISDDLVPEVVTALAKRAKTFEVWVEGNGYGNIPGDAETVKSWQSMADNLWTLVRALGSEREAPDAPLKIVSVS